MVCKSGKDVDEFRNGYYTVRDQVEIFHFQHHDWILEYERETFPYLRERSVTDKVHQSLDGSSQTVGCSDVQSSDRPKQPA